MTRATLVKIWIQDPSTSLGFGKILCHQPVQPGPEDPEIRICPAQGPVRANDSQNFDFDPDEHPDAFRAAHCYGVARIVVDWAKNWEVRCVASANALQGFVWEQQSPETASPLEIYPDAGHCADACQLSLYSPQSRSIRLLSFTQNDGAGSRELFAAHSFDIVAHEVGHAVLDALLGRRLQRWDSPDEVAAIKESFADLTVVLSFLSRTSLCEALLLEARGRDLLSARFLTEFAEEVAVAKTGKRYGIRVLDDRVWVGRRFGSRHQQSLLITSPIVRAIESTFHKRQAHRLGREDAVLLHAIGEELTDAVVTGFLNVAPEERYLAGVARSILDCLGPALRREVYTYFEEAFGDNLHRDCRGTSRFH